MSIRLNPILWGLIFLSVTGIATAQTLVQDTLIVKFPATSTNANIPFRIDSILDQRSEPEKLVGKFQKTVYLFVPIDLMAYTHAPLRQELKESLSPSPATTSAPHFKLIIQKFELFPQTNSLFYPRYQCLARFQVYRHHEHQPDKPIGTLVYESTARKPFWGGNLRENLNQTLEKFQTKLIHDLTGLTQTSPSVYNLRPIDYHAKPLNLLAGTDFIWGTRTWLIDGEIVFSANECQRKFFRNGYNLRYRKGDDFESIQFSLSNDYLYYRVNPHWLLRMKSQLMYGFNLWNDFKTTKHEIWDAFIVSYSLSQSFQLNPLDRRGITLGLGILEDVYYIYSQQVQFQVGMILNLGVKL